MRASGKLRVDGIVRALGGFYAGAFTTSQRDAIASGSRPYGLVILNTTTNRLEWNAGSDGSPSWQSVGVDGSGAPSVVEVPVGAMTPYAGATAPTGWLLCDGSAVSRTTYAALYAVVGSTYGAGNGTTTFNLPDMRGRVAVGKNAGTFSALGAQVGEETHSLSVGEMPAHDHGGVTSYASAGTPAGSVTVNGSGTLTTGTESASHTHSGTTGGRSAPHSHTYTQPNVATGVSITPGGDSYVGTITAGVSTSTESSDHAHNFTSGNASASHAHSVASHTHTATFAGTALGTHQHAVASQGGGGAHNNVQPSLTVNHIIRH